MKKTFCLTQVVLVLATTVNSLGCATRPQTLKTRSRGLIVKSQFLVPANSPEYSEMSIDRSLKTSPRIAKASHQLQER